jgi:FAD:protein FMN transferase
LDRLERHLDAMGSTFSLVLYDEDHAAIEATVDAAWAEVRRLERLFSCHDPRSALSQVNRQASTEPVTVAPELFDAVSLCLGYSLCSKGAFDITVGPLVETWGFSRGTGRMPSEGAIASASASTGSRHVALDSSRRTIRFSRPGMRLDMGGIGKGIAVDHIVDIVKNAGITCGLIAGAGSSLYGIGCPPEEGRGWGAEIRDPSGPRRAAVRLFLKDQALATSGSFEKNISSGGTIHSHVIDPRTGVTAQGAFSVSVLAQHAIDAEAWTKACILNGRPWAAANLPRGMRAFFIGDGHSPAWVCGPEETRPPAAEPDADTR